MSSYGCWLSLNMEGGCQLVPKSSFLSTLPPCAVGNLMNELPKGKGHMFYGGVNVNCFHSAGLIGEFCN